MGPLGDCKQASYYFGLKMSVFISFALYYLILKEKDEKDKKAKEKDPIKEVAAASKAAAKWRHKDKDDDEGIEDGKDTGKDDDSEKSNGQSLVKYGKGRKPMVKMPSKDSGYSVQSSGSAGSGAKTNDSIDTLSWDSIHNRRADSGTGSLGTLPALSIDKKRQNMIKQQSTDNVSPTQKLMQFRPPCIQSFQLYQLHTVYSIYNQHIGITLKSHR